jgi:hypothetical protein
MGSVKGASGSPGKDGSPGSGAPRVPVRADLVDMCDGACASSDGAARTEGRPVCHGHRIGVVDDDGRPRPFVRQLRLPARVGGQRDRLALIGREPPGGFLPGDRASRSSDLGGDQRPSPSRSRGVAVVHGAELVVAGDDPCGGLRVLPAGVSGEQCERRTGSAEIGPSPVCGGTAAAPALSWPSASTTDAA